MTGTPLVAEGDPLSDDELQRYSRQLRMQEIGLSGQRRLKNARVLVIGAGGIGSPVILYLAAAGVGTIGVVDDDTVSLHNLHRQIIHRTGSIGEAKLTSVRRAVGRLNPHVTMVEHPIRMDANSAPALVAGYDLVIDGSDSFETRYIVSDAAATAGIPHVWGSVLRGDGQVSVFWDRGDADSRSLRDLFPGSVDDTVNCEVAGVVGPLCGTVGSVMATEAIKLITGSGRPLRGRLLVVDAFDSTFAEVAFSRRQAPRPGASGEAPTEGGSVQDQDASITATELAELLRAREAGENEIILVDIREPFEREIVAIEGSLFIPMQGLMSPSAVEAMPQDATVILHCHHDSRSQYARAVLEQNGWADVRYLEGGIHEWVTQIEPEKRTY